MPADLIKVGDAFDLTIDAEVDTAEWGTIRQTVALAHGADLVMSAGTSSHVIGVLAPDLTRFQINVSGGSSVCETLPVMVSGCGYRSSAAVVTVAGDSATVLPGWTARIGWLSFTNGGSQTRPVTASATRLRRRGWPNSERRRIRRHH